MQLERRAIRCRGVPNSNPQGERRACGAAPRWSRRLVAAALFTAVVGAGTQVNSQQTREKAYGDVHYERSYRPGVGVPPAVFSHWIHRIRFRCSVCHPVLFQMQKTEGPRMVELQAGMYCGACHNGRTAFQISFGTCVRCHPDAR